MKNTILFVFSIWSFCFVNAQSDSARLEQVFLEAFGKIQTNEFYQKWKLVISGEDNDTLDIDLAQNNQSAMMKIHGLSTVYQNKKSYLIVDEQDQSIYLSPAGKSNRIKKPWVVKNLQLNIHPAKIKDSVNGYLIFIQESAEKDIYWAIDTSTKEIKWFSFSSESVEPDGNASYYVEKKFTEVFTYFLIENVKETEIINKAVNMNAVFSEKSGLNKYYQNYEFINLFE